MKLSQNDIQAKLATIPGWKQEGKLISKIFTFPDFLASMAFVNQVAELAEVANHHPDILISYSSVQIYLYTHSENGITDQDFDLADKVNGL